MTKSSKYLGLDDAQRALLESVEARIQGFATDANPAVDAVTHSIAELAAAPVKPVAFAQPAVLKKPAMPEHVAQPEHPAMPELPDMPKMAAMPELPDMPKMAAMPELPAMPPAAFSAARQTTLQTLDTTSHGEIMTGSAGGPAAQSTTSTYAAADILSDSAALASGLRFAMPKLENPTIVDLNKTGDKDYFQFRPDEDVLFIASTTTRTLPKLQTDGGRNIVLVGGEYAPQGGDAGATIYFTNLHGSAYVEGIHVDQSGIGDRDAIAVYGAAGASPTVTLQNVRVDNVHGKLNGVHGDVFQTHGPVGDIRMYNVTGSGDYQGIFIPPQKPTGSAYLENVNLKYTSTDHAGYLLWLLDDANEKPFPVTLKNVNVEAPAGWNAGEQIVWPKASLGGNLAAKVDGNQISWPGLPYTGHVTVGAPAGGDYVKASEVGVGYKHVEGTAPTGGTTTPTPTPTPAPAPAPTPAPATGDLPQSGAPVSWKTGTAGNDTLTGTDANNFLNGADGKDLLIGGKGSDTYVVNQADDVIRENSGEGVDTVVSWSPSYTLAGYVENLKLDGTANLNGTGNQFANRIEGNSGNNLLNGMGGKDLLTGGAGSDTFVVAKGNGSDIITDFAQGVDKVMLQGYGFTTLAEVKQAMVQQGGNVVLKLSATESLTFRGDTIGTFVAQDFGFSASTATPSPAVMPVPGTLPQSGAPVTWKTGTVGNDTLTGTDANNFLNGADGKDLLIGGKGSDTYVVNQADDVIRENSGEGVDTVVSWSPSYTLAGYVENLKLDGTANLNGTGNQFANRIEGNSGNNLLNGMGGNDILIGGNGADQLSGGTGSDSFVFRAMAEKGDVIKDFEVGKDVLDLRPLMASIQAPSANALGHYVTLVQQGANTAVMVDVTGQGNGEQLVVLENTQASQLMHFADHWM